MEDRPGSGVLDAVVVGAGFSGLYMLHRMRGMGMTVRVLERASGVGGTWYWNRYPGARCDIESLDYQYSFSDELLRDWQWTERYASQPEILAYLEHVADRFDLRRDISFGVSVRSAHYDAQVGAWDLTTEAGEQVRARFCVMATGNLSDPAVSDLPGFDTFGGRWLHTGQWPDEPVELAGRRVAVVGTGSSGIQTVTAIAPVVDHLYVLQRTPNYSMPAHNRPLSGDEREEAVRDFAHRRHICEWSDAGTPLDAPVGRAVDAKPGDRVARYEEGWQRGGISALSFAFTDMFTDEQANRYAQDFARAKVRETVRDLAVADKLCPSHHIGTKRTCVDTGYFETFNRYNVELVDVREDPLVAVTPTGLRTRTRALAVDVIVFAIGFDAITGALADIDIRGRDGLRLLDAWADGPRTLLGIQSAGFPNLYMITGPGSPSVLSNMVVSIEQHVDWVVGVIEHLRSIGADTIEPTTEAQDAWMAHIESLAQPTLYSKANSWYVGANIRGKPKVFSLYVAGCGAYRRECDEIAASGYQGFLIGNHEDQRNVTVSPTCP